MFLVKFIGCVLLGYLLGSVPFALVIGKGIYKTDLRTKGSGNLGGTNAGRVLGKKVGLLVISLDILKVVFAVWAASYVSTACAMCTGVACCVGHCWPVFNHFKGGKAVATMFGFLLSISIFVFHNGLYFFGPLVMFLSMLYIFKMVSLASISAAICSTIQIVSLNFSFSVNNCLLIIASIGLSLLVTIRHKANIEKVKSGKEGKITWM
ncbi:MAG: glycerol-3-phosphate 1-O-acyltransferase PlsY [Ileibacterium sp.]|nr:glycerol-3-phosphate 1-O-acyltransferase PlsY [Ileibacterium sp.]